MLGIKEIRSTTNNTQNIGQETRTASANKCTKFVEMKKSVRRQAKKVNRQTKNTLNVNPVGTAKGFRKNLCRCMCRLIRLFFC